MKTPQEIDRDVVKQWAREACQELIGRAIAHERSRFAAILVAIWDNGWARTGVGDLLAKFAGAVECEGADSPLDETEAEAWSEWILRRFRTKR